jgi:drug/metabolite transporter (DMT)-like permease
MSRIDALLVLMVVIWGANYSVIKRCFADIPPQPFNAVRLTIASGLFLIAIRIARRRAQAAGGTTSSVTYTPNPLTTRDRVWLGVLGVVGHTMYQLFFVGGVALTAVSNGALIIGTTPVVVAMASAVMGRERIGWWHWVGALVSIVGIYFVVGHGASFGGASFRGDLLVMLSVACWSAYTLGASRLTERHSPLYVTGITMAIGTVPYVILALPQCLRVDWAGLPAWIWVALIGSAVFALCLAYLIWYAAVQRIGPARTSAYSNVVPIAAMSVAAIWLGEPISMTKALGAVAVLSGVFFTRLGRKPVPVCIEE